MIFKLTIDNNHVVVEKLKDATKKILICFLMF